MMPRFGVSEGRLLAEDVTLLAPGPELVGKARLGRVQVGTQWFFWEGHTFPMTPEHARTRLNQLAQRRQWVRVGWVEKSGRRMLTWVRSEDDASSLLSTSPRAVVAEGLVTMAIGAAAIAGGWWLLGDLGAGFWRVLIGMLLAVVGILVGVIGCVVLGRGLSRPTRRLHDAMRAPWRPAAQAVSEPMSADRLTTAAYDGGPVSVSDTDSPLESHEGRVTQVQQATQRSTVTQWHPVWQSHHLTSEHVVITLAGSDTPYLLRTTRQDDLFLQAGDVVRIVGQRRPAGFELCSLRNLTDGAAYVAVPGAVLLRWCYYGLAAILVVLTLYSVADLLLDGRATRAALFDVIGTSLVVAGGVAVLMRLLGWWGLDLQEVLLQHTPSGDRRSLRRARTLLGLPRRGGAVWL